MLRVFWSFVVLLIAILLYFWVPNTYDSLSGSDFYSVSPDTSLVPFFVNPQLKNRVADTTAVILNWSRRSNVIKIASSLCSDPILEDTIAQVYVWNNSPDKLSHQDFPLCAVSKLKIHNSPSNLYFQARFLACAEATTPFCFIQDDDYFILPEVLSALRSRYPLKSGIGIHLLPPHEAMSSHLKRIRVGSKIHTGFAWLGHGTIIQQAHAQQFLSLMNILNASTEELKMADNYFTLLSNSFPQVWLDQGIELGGGQPFTVGEEGDDRNKRHILRATQMLDQLLDCTSPPCIKTDDVLPYVALDDGDQQTITRTPCIGTPCVLETSISPFIDHLRLDAPSATSLLEIESVNRKSVNEDMPDYLQNPFSHAVDSNPKTAFCASKGAKANDSIVLDLLQQTPKWKHTDLVILVDKVSEEILVQALAIESAHAGGEWLPSSSTIKCTETHFELPSKQALRECHARIRVKDISKFRILFQREVGRFCIHEVWARGLL